MTFKGEKWREEMHGSAMMSEEDGDIELANFIFREVIKDARLEAYQTRRKA